MGQNSAAAGTIANAVVAAAGDATDVGEIVTNASEEASAGGVTVSNTDLSATAAAIAASGISAAGIDAGASAAIIQQNVVAETILDVENDNDKPDKNVDPSPS